MISRTKEWLRRNAPGVLSLLRNARARVTIEYKVLRQMRPGDMIAGALRPQAWRRLLPVQRPSILKVEGALTGGVDALRAELQSGGLPFREGTHSLYLPPETWRASSLGRTALAYPDDAGIKLLRSEGLVEEAAYCYGADHSHLQRQATFGHPHLTLVANFLYWAGAGPRLYDLAGVRAGGRQVVGYVVRHVAGRQPTVSECEAGVARLQALTRSHAMAVIAPGGFSHPDFVPPDCNGNAIMTEAGEFRYVDFQNFILRDYRGHLRRLARAAAAETHFGDRSVLRGGAYLYQSVPGAQLPAKRDVASRMRSVETLLASMGCDLEGRLVLDVGCNLGMMMGEYLRLGAAWVHGWDFPLLVPHAERLLLAIGGTRFSLTGAELHPAFDLAGSLPEFARRRLAACLVSYLAVRGHIGWLDALSKVPWGYLLYEGHEGESVEATIGHLDAFRARGVRFEYAPPVTYRDGDSDPRVITLLRRTR